MQWKLKYILDMDSVQTSNWITGLGDHAPLNNILNICCKVLFYWTVSSIDSSVMMNEDKYIQLIDTDMGYNAFYRI